MSALDAQLAALLRGSSDWPAAQPAALVERAVHHGIAPLLFEALEYSGAHTAPALRESLRASVLQTAALELQRRHELQRLLERFRAAGIVPIVLKGTALAYSLYPQPHLRPRVDVDLLVPLDLRERACELMQREGYAGDGSAAGRFVRTQVEFHTRAAAGLLVDLHWRISTSPMFNAVLSYETLRHRAAAAPRLDAAARVPCPVDALLHACAHRAARLPTYGAGLDRGDRLIWLQDIKLLAASLDAAAWADLLARATEHGLCAVCVDAFDRVLATLGADVPEEVLAALRRGARRSEPSAAFLTGHRWRIFAAELASLASAAERLAYVRERSLPPAGYLRAKYGGDGGPLPALYARHLLEGLRRR